MKQNSYMNKLLKQKQSGSSGTKLNKLTLETLKKFDVDLERVENEVVFLNFGIIDYEEKTALSVFGENKAISYLLSFVIYNIEFQAKLMTFEYSTRSELLKLDLVCKTLSAEKEIKYCCNSLQRRRNLNLMFSTLIKFSRFLESRRLICDVILKKNSNIDTEENKDGGKIITYSNNTKCLKLGIFWNVECNSQHEVVDKIEAYYKVEELSNREDIRNTLKQLTEPFLEFNEKYHLWDNLLKLLSKDSSIVHVDCGCPNLGIVDEGRAEASTFEGISIIRHPYLTSDRYTIKIEKEEPIDSGDDEIDIMSSAECPPSRSSSSTSDTATELGNKDVRIVSVSKRNLKGKDGYSNLKVYKGLLNDRFITGNANFGNSRLGSDIILSKPDRRSEAPNLFKKPYFISRNPHQGSEDCSIVSLVSSNKTRMASISISDSDLEDVNLLSSDREVSSTSSRKRHGCAFYNLNKQGSNVLAPDPNLGSKVTFVEIDLSPPKKYKNSDDDLEITSVTYVIPD